MGQTKEKLSSGGAGTGCHAFSAGTGQNRITDYGRSFGTGGLLTGLAWIGAACALVAGLALLLADVWAGVLVIGGGVLLLGLGLVGMALSVMLYGMLLPRCIRGVVDWISRMLHRGRHGNV